ncbi:MAG: GNAT family N-acetyltransferase [Planctomycetota bacterium]
MKKVAALALSLPFVLGACASTKHVDVSTGSPFTPAWTPSWSFDTEMMRLEPLRPAVAKLDYDGFMSSIPQLQASLHWGSWPNENFTLEQNEKDLVHHWNEFGTGENYAYTVLSPDRSHCLGCIYINSVEDAPRTAEVAYWVTDEGLAMDLDRHLLEQVTAWFQRDWPLDRAVFPTHVENARGQELAEQVGLVKEGEPNRGRVAWVWTRAS